MRRSSVRLGAVSRKSTLRLDSVTRRGSVLRGNLLDQTPSSQDNWGGHPHDPSEHIGDAGVAETVWNVMNLVVGGGVLSMPFICKLSGWVGLGIICLIGGLFCFTAKVIGVILGKSMDMHGLDEVPKDSRDYAWLAQKAFGDWGVCITASMMIFENWSAAVCYLIFVGANLHLVTGASVISGVIMAGILSLVMLYIPLRMLSYIGMIGMLFASVAVLMLAAEGATTGVEANRIAIDPIGIGTAGGMVLFCYAGHACLPSVYWSMRHPVETYGKACMLAYSGIIAFYGISAAIGYYFFGDALTNSFTESMKTPAVQLTAISAILIKVQSAIPPALAAPLLLVENLCEFQTERSKLIWRCTAAAFSIYVAAVFSDWLTQLVALSGYLTTSYDSIIFPSIVAWKLGDRSASLLLVAIIGILIAIVGTYSSVAGL